jgi:hypothetical protein
MGLETQVRRYTKGQPGANPLKATFLLISKSRNKLYGICVFADSLI